MKIRSHALVLATLLATTPVAAVAQSAVNTADPVYTQQEDDDFPWGLLGLLGLAGLLGLKRRDDDRVNRTSDRR